MQECPDSRGRGGGERASVMIRAELKCANESHLTYDKRSERSLFMVQTLEISLPRSWLSCHLAINNWVLGLGEHAGGYI